MICLVIIHKVPKSLLLTLTSWWYIYCRTVLGFFEIESWQKHSQYSRLRPSPWFEISLYGHVWMFAGHMVVVQWDAPFGTLVTLIYRDSSGMYKDCPGTSLMRSSSTKSHQFSGMSQDYPGMSLVESSGHQLVTPALRDIPGLSWDVPHGILQTPSHTSLQGHPRTVLGCP